MKSFIPYILAVALFFAGRWTGPKPDTELLKKYETERIFHVEQIKALKAKADDLAGAGKAIREKMYSDSLKFSSDLRANKEAYLKLKKKYNEINLIRANAQSLDSLVSSLYPNPPI
jgi:hypothetical protein